MFEDQDKEALKQLIGSSVFATVSEFELLRLPEYNDVKSCLNAYSKDTLIYLAQINGIELKKSWKKAKVVNQIFQSFKDTQIERLLAFSEEELELFDDFLNNRWSEEEKLFKEVEFYVTLFPNLTQLGILYSKINGDKFTTLSIDEIQSLLNQRDKIKKEHKQKELNYFMIEEIVQAAVHLYGVVDKEQVLKLWEIKYPQFNYTVDFYQYFYQMIPVITIANGYEYVDDQLIAIPEFDDEEEIKAFYFDIYHTFGSDYYEPSKNEIEYYAQYENDKQSISYKRVKEQIRKYSPDPYYAMSIIESHLKFGNTLSQVMNEINDLELLEFETQKQTEKFAKAFVQLHNHTRMWSLHGYTPLEMHEKGRKIEDRGEVEFYLSPKEHENNVIPFADYYSEVTTNKEPVENPYKNVGRNDPCPCGSGKKFKKCCIDKV